MIKNNTGSDYKEKSLKEGLTTLNELDLAKNFFKEFAEKYSGPEDQSYSYTIYQLS